MQLHQILTNHISFVSDKSLVLTSELQRKDFTRLKALLLRLGAQWDTKQSEFIFTRHAPSLVQRIIDLGSSNVNKFHLYPSTPKVFDFMKEFTPICYLGASGQRKLRVLEPSIGLCYLATALKDFLLQEGRDCILDGYDIDPLNVELSLQKGFNVQERDFLTVEPEPIYDLVLMNPPFDGSAFVDHVRHASRFLTPTGVLVSVIPVNMPRLLKDDVRHRWLMDRIRLYCPEQLEEGNFLDKDTFKNVSIDTTVITLNSESAYQKDLASARTLEAQLCSLSLSIDNNPKELSLLSERNTQVFSVKTIDMFLSGFLDTKLNEELNLHPSFVEQFKQFIQDEYLPLTKRIPKHSLCLDNLLFGASLMKAA